jgi:hypothetical protein
MCISYIFDQYIPVFNKDPANEIWKILLTKFHLEMTQMYKINLPEIDENNLLFNNHYFSVFLNISGEFIHCKILF